MIVLKTEVKIFRNISGFNFVDKIDIKSAEEIENKVTETLFPLGYELRKTKEMNSLDKLKLYESYNATGDIFKNELISGIYTSSQKPNVFLNDSDHIVIQSMSDGLELENIYDNADKLDDFVAEKIKFAYSEKFGFLTSNPNLCGNGMSASVLLHLPATSYFGNDSLISSLERLGYRVDRLNSERGSIDSILKLSPDRTIGITEKEYINKLNNITKEIVDIEEQNRKKLYMDYSIELEDIANRALGILSCCRMISENEVIEKLSDLFMGIELSILKPKIDLSLSGTITKFKNGRLQIQTGSLLDMKSRDVLRAKEVRKMMKEVF